MYRVVTTTNAAGWEQTGRRMASSFRDRWPIEARPLILYAEDFAPEEPEGVSVRHLPQWLTEFKEQNADRNGLRNGGRYDYRFDAVKFAHKVAALTDYALSLNDGVLIWLDADIYTHSDVTVEWLDARFRRPSYIAWLNRANAHPECGVLMFRCEHPYHREFMETIRDIYTSGQIFKMAEHHDSYIMQQVVRVKVGKGLIPPPTSLSGDAVRTSHPAINGPWGAKIDHAKGPRKAAGRSNRRDLIRPRPEPYWQNI